jgi:UDP-N-acetylglucosamine transferase subunit ALG13
MIFVTLGTEKHQFNRLLRALDEAESLTELHKTIFAQIGASTYLPKHFSYTRFLTFPEMRERMAAARIVVAHGGVGSTILSLSLGKTPILMPRKTWFHENIDDHQVDYVRTLNRAGRVLAAFDEQELVEQVLHYDRLVCDLGDDSGESTRKKLVRFLHHAVGNAHWSAVNSNHALCDPAVESTLPPSFRSTG